MSPTKQLFVPSPLTVDTCMSEPTEMSFDVLAVGTVFNPARSSAAVYIPHGFNSHDICIKTSKDGFIFLVTTGTLTWYHFDTKNIGNDFNVVPREASIVITQ